MPRTLTAAQRQAVLDLMRGTPPDWPQLFQHLVCLVSTGATDIWNNNNPQFLAYLDGALVCGLDVNHTEFDLAARAQAGQRWQLGLYTYCNTPAQDVFLRVETALRDDEVTALYYDLKAPFEVMALGNYYRSSTKDRFGYKQRKRGNGTCPAGESADLPRRGSFVSGRR